MGAQYDDLGNYTGYTNDDGTTFSGFGEPSLSPTSVRPDLLASANQTARERMLQLNNDPAYKQFTPEQASTFLNFKGSPDDLAAYSRSISPFEKFGIYSDQSAGGNNMWFGPEAGPQHNDTGPEQFQTAWNDMRNGLAIMALPFAAAGGAALVGGEAAGAGAVGAGAAEGGAAATGVDASTGLFAGESATSGAAGATEGGVLSGSTGSASLVGDASTDAAAADSAPGFDPGGEGMYNVPTNSSNTIFPNGMDASSPGLLQRAQDMAKQLGITPASALQTLIKAAGRAAPAALGAVAANQQSNSLGALADKYLEFGAPSRARYEASFAPGFTMKNDPGYQDALDASSKASMHALSVNGNPAGSPNAWAQSMEDLNAKFAYPALQNFRNTNANAGGIASLQTAAPGAATAAIGARSGVYDAIGAGVNDIFNPRPSLAQTMADYRRMLSGSV